MPTMSYCAFENTANDLDVCLDKIKEGRDFLEDASQYERDGLEDLLVLCEEIIQYKGDIQDALIKWDENDAEEDDCWED